MKLGVILFIGVFCFSESSAQVDTVGSGRAISFDGTSSYISLGDVYNNLTLPITLEAWVNIPNEFNYAFPIFFSEDNPSLYAGVSFAVTPTSASIGYGDGLGGGTPSYRRTLGVSGLPNMANRWVHITGVIRGPVDMSLYVNGVDVGGAYSGDSNSPLGTNVPNGVARIGYWTTTTSGVFHFKGGLDELRFWNRSLSQAEIQKDMCRKLTGKETGLLGYWNFNETSGNLVYDKTANVNNGQLMNSPSRVFSGAPIGDASKFLYTSNWTGINFSMTDGDEQAVASNVQGSPEGIHIYEVKNLPTSTIGLDTSAVGKPYFGIFSASLDANNSFDATYLYKNTASCQMFSRTDNSVTAWSNNNNPLSSVSNRLELIRSKVGQTTAFDLGPDKILCNQSSTNLVTGITDPQVSILWSTGESTSSIIVSQSGTYSVKASGICGVVKDSVKVLFSVIPPPFDLGPDKILCDQISTVISTGVTNPLMTVLWNTGESTSSIIAKHSGKFAVKVSSACGILKDSIQIKFEPIPIPISLGEDQTLCAFKPAQLKAVNNNDGYQIQWQDNSTGVDFIAKDFGKYWVSVKNDCGAVSDTITFSRVRISMDSIPNVITPNGDKLNQFFKINNSLKGNASLLVLNRWGREVFKSDSYQNDWDGGGLDAGIYFLVLNGPCFAEIKETLTIIH